MAYSKSLRPAPFTQFFLGEVALQHLLEILFTHVRGLVHELAQVIVAQAGKVLAALLFDQASLHFVIGQRPGLVDLVHAQDVISDLAERSLMDVVQWSTHRYHREHEPPSAG